MRPASAKAGLKLLKGGAGGKLPLAECERMGDYFEITRIKSFVQLRIELLDMLSNAQINLKGGESAESESAAPSGYADSATH